MTDNPANDEEIEFLRGALTVRQYTFCQAYLGHAKGNATEAARLAGYSGDGDQLGRLGRFCLKHPAVRRYLSERVRRHMDAKECLSILASHSRGSMEDFIHFDEDGRPQGIDLAQARERGQLHLIKKLSIRQGTIEIELYDAQTATAHIARHHNLLQEKNVSVGLHIGQIDKILAILPSEFREGVQAALAEVAAEPALEETHDA